MSQACLPGLSPKEAVVVYGGYVRYYHSTESCRYLADLAGERKPQRVLACCGGGDQALTLLAGLDKKGVLWAFDLQPAQLFVLAAKALFMAQRKKIPFYPSFSGIQKMYPGRISAQPPDRRRVDRLYAVKAKCFRNPPQLFQEKFFYECDGGLFEDRKQIPFWSRDPGYVREICQNALRLRLLRADLFYLDDFFRPATADLIYVSDIAWAGLQPFLLQRLAASFALLKKGGCLAANADSGERFMGKGVSVADMLKKNASRLGLRAAGGKGTLRIFEKT